MHRLTYQPRHDKTNKMSVRPAKTQFLHANSEDSDQTGRIPRLIWVFAGCTLSLLVLSCRGSIMSLMAIHHFVSFPAVRLKSNSKTWKWIRVTQSTRPCCRCHTFVAEHKWSEFFKQSRTFESVEAQFFPYLYGALSWRCVWKRNNVLH